MIQTIIFTGIILKDLDIGMVLFYLQCLLLLQYELAIRHYFDTTRSTGSREVTLGIITACIKQYRLYTILQIYVLNKTIKYA